MTKINNIMAVIVAYNDYKALNSCINSLKNQINHILVIDNSTVNDKFYNKDKNIKYFKSDGNIGLGKALNIGIKECLNFDIDWILLLDQDSILDENMINQMLNSYTNANNKKIVQIVPVVYDNNTSKYLPSLIYNTFGLKKVFYPREDTYVDFQITSGSLIKKDLFNKIGFMDEDFFIDYIDYDYCFRIRSHKYEILLSKSAILNHSLGEKSYKIGIPYIQHSSTRIFYQVKNRLILMRRYRKEFPFFVISQLRNLILKFFKILLLEDEKKEKLRNFYKAILASTKKE